MFALVSTVVFVLILATNDGTGHCICKTVHHAIIYTVSHMASHRLIRKTNWRLTCPVCTAPELHTHTLGHQFHTDRLSSLLGSVDGSTWCCSCSAWALQPSLEESNTQRLKDFANKVTV